MGRHYVAQEYLRGFATTDDPTRVWQYDKKTRAWSNGPAAISKVAQQADYYDEETERQLATLVENAGHAALRRIRSGDDLTDAERQAFVYYICVAIMRVPRQRRKRGRWLPKSWIVSWRKSRHK